MSCCNNGCDPRVARNPPVQLNGHPGNDSSSGSSIQNGRLVHHQRRSFFSRRLYRTSQVMQNPTQITYRELCLVLLGLYTLYKLWFAVAGIWNLTMATSVNNICYGPYGTSFGRCVRHVSWCITFILGSWAGQVVPWAFITALAVLLGEEVLRRRG